MELLIIIDALRRASSRRITAVLPYFGYARQDRKPGPRTPISAKLVANLIAHAGADRVMTLDLHAGQIQGFFRIPVDHMTALPLFARYYRETLGLHGEGVVAVSPDPGRAKMATKFAQMLDADFALMNKQRPAHDIASVTEVVGDVHGKVAIMSDDIIVTGGTLVAGAQALLDAGATKIYACATHGLFPDEALEKLAGSELAGITVTDTVPIPELNRPDKLSVLTISGILAETIENVFSDESVSAIFAGENQLF
jgi:ribose-phosphate pyrophosphokinase